MPFKKSYILPLMICFTAFYSCQKDIPVLGEDDNESTKSKVYIRSIVLSQFNSIDANTGLPWDNGSVQVFDSLDFIGPDIYFNYFYKSDSLDSMYFYQTTHFQNVQTLAVNAPLAYYLTTAVQIPAYFIDTTFYLKMYDLDYNGILNDSTLIDSIPFAIGPDFNQGNPYISSISSTGFNGSQVTLLLEWK